MGTRALLLLAVIIVAECTEESFVWNKTPVNYESEGKRLVDWVLEAHHGVYLITQCAYLCHSDARCLSFNFIGDDLICELNSATSEDHPESLADDIPSQYVNKNTYYMDEASLGPCASSPCANDGNCLNIMTSEGAYTFLCVCPEGWTGINCTVQGSNLSWGAWSDWSECSVTCGQGWERRVRQCYDMDTMEERTAFDCYGADVEVMLCHGLSCPYWSEWSDWTECSTADTCGRGFQSRTRQCMNNGVAGLDRLCMGVSNETAPCQTPGCSEPVRLIGGESYGEGVLEVYDELAETWGRVCADAWDVSDADVVCRQLGFASGAADVISTSTVSAGTMFLSQVACLGSENSFQSCSHAGWQTVETCTSAQEASVQCIVDGGWSTWSEWGICSVSCADGIQTRTRTCDYPPTLRGGRECAGSNKEIKDCTLDPCPVDGEWRAWEPWTPCNVSCGGGIRTRDRTCNLPQHGGETCTGESHQEQECAVDPCPVDCVWKIWSDWGECSTSCAEGSQTRTRTRDVVAQYGGQECTGELEETRTCDLGPCPVDGQWLQWSTWSECTVTCGGGIQSRSRACNFGAYGGTNCTGDSAEEQACSETPCPVDGVWQEWSVWSECSTSCEAGTQTRSRVCTPPLHGGIDCQGEAEESQDCDLGFCPVDGYWEEWSVWSECSVSCGEGEITRSRVCVEPIAGGAECPGSSTESEPCSIDCAKPGEWGDWGYWGLCSVTCGGGWRTRSRECNMTTYGDLTAMCEGSGEESKTCHEYDCNPVAANCAEWHERGLSDSCQVTIEPHPDFNFEAFCNLTAVPGEAITEIYHDSMARTLVHGFESAGEYSKQIVYDESLQAIDALKSVSTSCRQYISWECYSATITNPHDSSILNTFWVGVDNEMKSYWGGVPHTDQGCACGMDGSCADSSKLCNCDKNDFVERQDDGYLGYKDDLPVTVLRAGDTGGQAENYEEGFMTLGPLQCYGYQVPGW